MVRSFSWVTFSRSIRHLHARLRKLRGSRGGGYNTDGDKVRAMRNMCQYTTKVEPVVLNVAKRMIRILALPRIELRGEVTFPTASSAGCADSDRWLPTNVLAANRKEELRTLAASER
jgi:hypothetical protein